MVVTCQYLVSNKEEERCLPASCYNFQKSRVVWQKCESYLEQPHMGTRGTFLTASSEIHPLPCCPQQKSHIQVLESYIRSFLAGTLWKVVYSQQANRLNSPLETGPPGLAHSDPLLHRAVSEDGRYGEVIAAKKAAEEEAAAAEKRAQEAEEEAQRRAQAQEAAREAAEEASAAEARKKELEQETKQMQAIEARAAAARERARARADSAGERTLEGWRRVTSTRAGRQGL